MSGKTLTYTLAAGNSSGYSTTTTGNIFKKLSDNKTEIAPEAASETMPEKETTYKHPITGQEMTKELWDEMQAYVENWRNMKNGSGDDDNYSHSNKMTEEVETIKIRTKNRGRER